MINNKPKALNIYQYGKLVKATQTIKEACEFVGVSKEYQEISNQEKAKWLCSSKYIQAKKRLDEIRKSDWYVKRKEYYVKELMDFCVYKKWRKAFYWQRVLMRKDLITLKKALSLLNDDDSTVYSIKDPSFFGESRRIKTNAKLI